jgi:hypothetical protein
MDAGTVTMFIPIVAILGAFAVAIANILSRARLRELKVRERIAMIEKGLVPPPEVDPAGFERAVTRQGRHRDSHRRAGVTLIGVGLGLIVLIWLTADDLKIALGVGGFLIVFGLAFLVNALLESRHDGGPSTRLPANTRPS